eukprot:TRINITY_DN6383_c0_g1_i1.p1 TRINITY_DN6383_c0_g1~~TRINITY_DN6383_c0_g1_i1.p1  ORF type:complete len:451 (-),score=87.40 TRINITY_DN6383_c0_g1_i1:51-1334(-)
MATDDVGVWEEKVGEEFDKPNENLGTPSSSHSESCEEQVQEISNSTVPEESFVPGAGDSSTTFGTMEVEDYAKLVTSILVPVCITMVIVITVVKSITFRAQDTVSAAFVYQESSSDSTGTRLGGSLLNALLILGMILATTVLFVCCYKYRCLKFLYGWLLLSTGMMLTTVGGKIFHKIILKLNIPMDYFTFGFMMWNFGVVGIIAIFWHSPLYINQMYLIFISSLLAIFLSQIPEFSTWTILGVVAIYDLFAVLCPGGPLRVLVELAQERNESIPALIYSASIWMMMAGSGSSSDDDDEMELDSDNQSTLPLMNNNTNPEVTTTPGGENTTTPKVRDKGRGVKLGLGDFVFYSVLVGRAAMFDMLTVYTSFIGIVTGLFFTILLLALWKKALPALPISIFFGILFYFVTKTFLFPYVSSNLLNGVVV